MEDVAKLNVGRSQHTCGGFVADDGFYVKINQLYPARPGLNYHRKRDIFPDLIFISKVGQTVLLVSKLFEPKAPCEANQHKIVPTKKVVSQQHFGIILW